MNVDKLLVVAVHLFMYYTACSSSLVAIAQACDSIVSGASDMALAGGVCILTSPRMHIMTSNAGAKEMVGNGQGWGVWRSHYY